MKTLGKETITSSSIYRKWRRYDPRTQNLFLMIVVLGAVLLILLIAGTLPRLARMASFGAQKIKAQSEVPQVHVQKAKADSKESSLKLPGNVQAWEEVNMYARTNGFLKKWYVDIGDHVKNGQLMAVIESPDVDQQVFQADHGVKQAQQAQRKDEANTGYNKLTMSRWINLRNQGAVSKEDADTKINLFKTSIDQVEADKEAVNAAISNLRHMQELKNFENVSAPFDGIITARTVNTGDLISSGSTTGTTVMFKVARIQTVRVFVEVPQRYVDSLRTGANAEINVEQLGTRKFHGKIVRNANELDATARTLLTEIDIDNPDGALYPGMYAQVNLNMFQDHPSIKIPATALVVKPDGNKVAIVTPDNRIHWQDIEIGRDFGDTMEATSGLKGGESLVVNPTDGVVEGHTVKIAKDDPTSQPKAK